MSKKMTAVAAGVLGFALLGVGAAPAFASTESPEQQNNVAQQGMINIAPQIAPIIKPNVAGQVNPQLVAGPNVQDHPVGLLGSN